MYLGDDTFLSAAFRSCVLDNIYQDTKELVQCIDINKKRRKIIIRVDKRVGEGGGAIGKLFGAAENLEPVLRTCYQCCLLLEIRSIPLHDTTAYRLAFFAPNFYRTVATDHYPDLDFSNYKREMKEKKKISN